MARFVPSRWPPSGSATAAVAAVLCEPRDCAVECSALSWVGKMLRCVATWCPVSRDMLNAKLADRGARRPPQATRLHRSVHVARCALHVSCPSHAVRFIRTEHRRRDQPESAGWERVPTRAPACQPLATPVRTSLLRHLSGLPSCDTSQDFLARRASKPLAFLYREQ